MSLKAGSMKVFLHDFRTFLVYLALAFTLAHEIRDTHAYDSKDI